MADRNEMAIRIGKLRKAMAEQGVTTLLICADQTNKEAVHFASNYRLLGQAAAAVIPEDGEPALFITETWDLDRARTATWFENVQALDEAVFYSETAKAAARATGTGGAVGIAGLDLLTKSGLDAVARALGSAKYKDGKAVIESACMIKTPYEIDMIRKGARLADIAFEAMLNAARPGIMEYELIAEIEYAVYMNGGTDNFQLGVTGKKNQAMIVPRNKAVEMGDLLLGEITPLIDSPTYAAQLCVTACMGRATPVQKEKYALLSHALEEALACMKPGVPVTEVARVQNEIIGKAGYADYCKPPYMRSRGHNFGLGRIDIAFGSTVELQEGMALVVHPNQFIPETGYLACGETVLVTRDGIERLNKMTPNEIYEVV